MLVADNPQTIAGGQRAENVISVILKCAKEDGVMKLLVAEGIAEDFLAKRYAQTLTLSPAGSFG